MTIFVLILKPNPCLHITRLSEQLELLFTPIKISEEFYSLLLCTQI